MKQAIDLSATLTALFVLNKSFKARFKRYWGVQTIDGVEVFNQRLTYYPNTAADNTQKALNVLGMKNVINDGVKDMQGIASAWLYLNADKVTASALEDLSANLIGRRFEDTYTYEQWYESQIKLAWQDWIVNYVSHVDGVLVVDKQGIENYIRANCAAVLGTQGVISETSFVVDGEDEYVQDVLAKYVWLDINEAVFEIVVDSVSLIAYSTREIGAKLTAGEWERALTYKTEYGVCVAYKIRRKVVSIDDADAVVVAAKELLDSGKLINDKVKIRSDRVLGSVASVAVGTTNELFYNGQLRTSALGLERGKFSKLIMTALDQDYQIIKKKKKWWQTLLAIVIVIVIVVVSWGYAAPAASAAWGASNIAYMATLVAVGLSVVQYVGAAAGYGYMFEMYDGLIKFAGIVGTITGVAAIAQRVAATAAMSATEALTAAKSFVTKNIWQVGLKAVGAVLQFVTGNKLKSIQNANNSLQSKIKEQEEELYNMYDKEYNLPLEVIQWTSNPMGMDQSMFAVDYQYEPTKLNICRRSFV